MTMIRSMGASLLVVGLLATSGCSALNSSRSDREDEAFLAIRAGERLESFIESCTTSDCGFRFDPGARIDSVAVDPSARSIHISFNPAFAQIPFREETVESIRARIEASLGDGFEGYGIDMWSRGVPVEELIPNSLRESIAIDPARRPDRPTSGKSLVLNLNRPFNPTSGLSGRHIAIWPSHGWYYEVRLDRWEFQRPRLFQTVEDLLPMSFVVPYLTPMLENAGASVYIPRERDPQPNEAIVDNDDVWQDSVNRYLEIAESSIAWETGEGGGFSMPKAFLMQGENPFRAGTYRRTTTDTLETAQVLWIPDFPESGEYAVNISYALLSGATTDARYTVHHLGGKTVFAVDQTMGGGTWIYLGTFRFEKGTHPETGQVTLSNQSSDAGRTLSADAVRFGGGMGNIKRGRSTSGRPRFTEAARYYMQFSGMPDTLVYNVTESLNDYVDDYRGRAEWMNYLRGAPSGPNKDRGNSGLGIPIDLSLAFHTDAGVTKSDTTIGTLMIYSSEGSDTLRVFPDGMSRLANRDLGDLIQTQVVEDIRTLYNPDWKRRSIWDRDYSEAVRPNVPGVLLELLSHQNYADMKYALDPRFRFDVSRAIYKAMGRFISSQNGESFVVEPLPVTHMTTEFTGPASVQLKWRPRHDLLEPTADPDAYIVYVRTGDTGFNNGILVEEPIFSLGDLVPGTVYSFRVAAVNEGGEGFPSEILSVGRVVEDGTPVVVVNGFDRISAPGTIEEGSWRGFAGFVDEGVPDRYDASYVGEQYDFEMGSTWLDDDSPGHGASFATFETKVLSGNTFDYPAVHGAAIMAAGRSFISTSDEVVSDGLIVLGDYDTVDLILGEERTTTGPGTASGEAFRAFPDGLKDALRTFTSGGGRLFVSGAYVGTDLSGPESTEADLAFSRDVLHFAWRTDHASLSGLVLAPDDRLMAFGTKIVYNTERTGTVYRVESPDAIEPVDETGETLLRYGDNNASAAVGYVGDHRVIVFGFPFETIADKQDRARTMRAVLEYLSLDKN